MNLGELRARFRKEIRDNVKPYFFDDETVDAWINEAQDEACRRALLIVDSTSDAASVSLSAGDIGADLDPSVIFIRRAKILGAGNPLVPKVARSMDEEMPAWEESIASTPLVFVPDWQRDYFRVWPPTRDDITIKMTVVRTALAPMVGDKDAPEIKGTYHVHLLDWAKHKAFAVPDMDAYDPKKSAAHEAAFVRNFGDRSPFDEHWAMEQYYDVGAN